MGYDIRGRSFNFEAWRYCLRTAGEFGWEPAGTEPPEEFSGATEWSGSYFGNDEQWVTKADAAALAKALYSAVRAIESGDIDGTNHHPGTLRALADIAVTGGFTIY